jgi:hypothetical protein
MRLGLGNTYIDCHVPGLIALGLPGRRTFNLCFGRPLIQPPAGHRKPGAQWICSLERISTATFDERNVWLFGNSIQLNWSKPVEASAGSAPAASRQEPLTDHLPVQRTATSAAPSGT